MHNQTYTPLKSSLYGVEGLDYIDAGDKALGRSESGILEAIFQSKIDPTKKALSATKMRQSTPEELMSWLDGRQATPDEVKLSIQRYPSGKVLKHAVIDVERGVKELSAFTFDGKTAVTVYQFRIFGEPGTNTFSVVDLRASTHKELPCRGFVSPQRIREVFAVHDPEPEQYKAWFTRGERYVYKCTFCEKESYSADIPYDFISCSHCREQAFIERFDGPTAV